MYLRLNPDVLLAIAAGTFRSGREHYEQYGHAEGRPTTAPPSLPRDKVVFAADAAQRPERPRTPSGSVDEIKLSSSGGIYVRGWVNDQQDRIDCLELHFTGWAVAITGANLARLRRPDAEENLGFGGHPFGFWGFLHAGRRLTGGACSAILRLKSGAELASPLHVEVIDDLEVRRLTLTALAQAQYLGNPYFAATAALDPTLGDALIDFNRALTLRAVNHPYVERFGGTRRYKGSIIVCLYGRPEYLFLQQALFAGRPGIEDYEFIYVCNSPEDSETLLKEARRSHRIYGLDTSIVILNANAGFGAANNAAAKLANSDRLLFVNPDVFPHQQDWAARHSGLVETLPEDQTALFGAPLYYDDGSLMHGGMYFEVDTAPAFGGGKHSVTSILRVEHYGKGAPATNTSFLRPRPVPAVTGAFISVQRGWFEKLEGFTEDYIFGHYEDADLCLKSLEEGRPAWLHDVRLYHLEGKGSIRQPVHEGGSVVNRWLFTQTWGETVRADLLGPQPTNPAFGAP